jgi:hypothetical protein
MKYTTKCLLLGLLGLSGLAQATCITKNVNILETRPDDRYVVVDVPVGNEVLDTVTKLVWQRCVVGMTWDGKTCINAPTLDNWQSALNRANTATPWRVPNQAELFSLAERACSNPAINTKWFPATPSGWAWSSSPLLGRSREGKAMAVSFVYGGATYQSTSNLNHVRLVRSDQ